jgi:hypothetical protein
MLSSGENLIGAHDGTADQNLLFTDFLTVVRYDNLMDFAAWYQISDPANHHIYSVRYSFVFGRYGRRFMSTYCFF